MSPSRYVKSVSSRLIAALLSAVVVWIGVLSSSTRAAQTVSTDDQGTGYQAAEIWHGSRRISGPHTRSVGEPQSRFIAKPKPRFIGDPVTADETLANPATRPTWINRPADDPRNDPRNDPRDDSRDDSRKTVAQDMLSEARRRIEQGQFQRARQLIRWARDLSPLWNSNGLSPESVANELQWREAEHPFRENPSRGGLPANPFRTPSSLDVDTRPNAPEPSNKFYDQRLRNLQTDDATPFDLPAAARQSDRQSPRTAPLLADARTVRSPLPGQTFAAAKKSNESAVLPPLVGFLAGVVCVLLVVAIGLAIVLRRFKAGGGSIFRVEIMSPQTAGQRASDGLSSAKTSSPNENQIATVIPFPMPPPTSTFADKRRQQQQQVEQQEQALLKHIFEANVQMHSELTKVNH